MAIEQVVKVPPVVALLNEIDARRRSVAVLAAGLGPTLEMLRAYVVETDARLSELERKGQGT